MRTRKWKNYFLLQALFVFAALGYVFLDGEKYLLVSPAIVVAFAFVMYVFVFLRHRKSVLAEHEADLAKLKTKQPWES